MNANPQLFNGYQPLFLKPFVVHRQLRGVGPRQVPRAFAAHADRNRHIEGAAQLGEIFHLGPGFAPLFPVTHPDAPSQPLIQFRYRLVVLRYAVIGHPAPDVFRDLLHPVVHGYRPAPSGQAFQGVLELVKRFLRPPDFLFDKGKSEE